jgi:arylsulfatase A-like enzyme
MSDEQPNVLFLCVDALRAFECIEDDRGAVMDAYDRLAENGIEFEQMIATSTTTSPAVASIHTGSYPFEHGVATLKGPRIRDGVPSFVELLNDAGYEIRALAHAPLTPSLGFDAGYDEYDLISYQDEISERGQWYDRIVAKFEDITAPWFYFVHLNEVHLPRIVDPKFEGDQYGTNPYERSISTVDALIDRVLDEIDLEETVVIYSSDHGESIAGTRLESWFDFVSPLAKLTQWRFEYGLSPPLDWLERRLNVLRRRGIHEYDRFTTVDHGFYPYDSLVRIPFTLAGPGVPDEGRVETQVRQIDIASTILDLAGVSSEPLVGSGESVLDAIDGDHRDAYMMANGPMYWDTDPFEGIRAPPWKYVTAGESSALYNLSADPVELTDVSNDQHQEITDLQQRLEAIKDFEPVNDTTALDDDEEADLRESLDALGYL